MRINITANGPARRATMFGPVNEPPSANIDIEYDEATTEALDAAVGTASEAASELLYALGIKPYEHVEVTTDETHHTHGDVLRKLRELDPLGATAGRAFVFTTADTSEPADDVSGESRERRDEVRAEVRAEAREYAYRVALKDDDSPPGSDRVELVTDDQTCAREAYAWLSANERPRSFKTRRDSRTDGETPTRPGKAMYPPTTDLAAFKRVCNDYLDPQPAEHVELDDDAETLMLTHEADRAMHAIDAVAPFGGSVFATAEARDEYRPQLVEALRNLDAHDAPLPDNAGAGPVMPSDRKPERVSRVTIGADARPFTDAMRRVRQSLATYGSMSAANYRRTMAMVEALTAHDVPDAFVLRNVSAAIDPNEPSTLLDRHTTYDDRIGVSKLLLALADAPASRPDHPAFDTEPTVPTHDGAPSVPTPDDEVSLHGGETYVQRYDDARRIVVLLGDDEDAHAVHRAIVRTLEHDEDTDAQRRYPYMRGTAIVNARDIQVGDSILAVLNGKRTWVYVHDTHPAADDGDIVHITIVSPFTGGTLTAPQPHDAPTRVSLTRKAAPPIEHEAHEAGMPPSFADEATQLTGDSWIARTDCTITVHVGSKSELDASATYDRIVHALNADDREHYTTEDVTALGYRLGAGTMIEGTRIINARDARKGDEVYDRGNYREVTRVVLDADADIVELYLDDDDTHGTNVEHIEFAPDEPVRIRIKNTDPGNEAGDPHPLPGDDKPQADGGRIAG